MSYRKLLRSIYRKLNIARFWKFSSRKWRQLALNIFKMVSLPVITEIGICLLILNGTYYILLHFWISHENSSIPASWYMSDIYLKDFRGFQILMLCWISCRGNLNEVELLWHFDTFMGDVPKNRLKSKNM